MTAPESTRKPVGQLLSADLPVGEPQKKGLLFVHACHHFDTVKNQEHLHGSVADSLIPSTKGWFITNE